MMMMHFYHSHLRTRIQSLVKLCNACQHFKLPGKGYGELPLREAQLAPWQEITVNLIGPWKINVNEMDLTLNMLLIIDTVTNLAELIRISSNSTAHVSLQWENAWLLHYPRPQFFIHDQGPEFMGKGFFKAVLHWHRIHNHLMTVKNLQANAISEHFHRTVTNILHPLLHIHPPQDINEANLVMDTALQTASLIQPALLFTTIYRLLQVH